MEIKALENESFLQLNIRGVLDTANALELENFIEKKISQGYRKFLLDLSQLETLSSGGIGFFIRILDKSKSTPKIYFAIINCHEEVLRLLRFFSLDKKLHIFKLLEKAKDFLKSLPSEQLDLKNKTEYESKKPDRPLNIRFYYKGQTNPANYAYKKGLVSTMEPVQKDHEKSTITNPNLDTENTQQNLNSTQNLQKQTTDSIMEILDKKMESIRNELQNHISEETKKFQEKIFNAIEKKVPYLKESKNRNNPQEIIPCEVCGVNLRVGKKGHYKCPCCKTEFYYKNLKSISVLEKLT